MSTEISEKGKDCLKCNHIPCVNLYDIVERDGETWLGDIRMLERFSKPFENKLHPPCLLGVAIFVLCKLLRALWETYEEKFQDREKMLPSTPFYLQGIRDLKATILLILTGHYRSAGAIMRSVLELYLSGLYFDYRYLKAQSDDERNEIFDEVRQFVKTGKYKVPERFKKYCKPEKEKELNFTFLINFLSGENVIKSFKSIDKLWKELNGYIHPEKFELPEKGYPVCSAMVSFVKEDYEKCLELFQKLLAVLLEDIIWNVYYTKLEFIDTEKLKSAANSVKSLKSAEKVLKDVIEEAIFSEKLRNFLDNKLLKIDP